MITGKNNHDASGIFKIIQRYHPAIMISQTKFMNDSIGIECLLGTKCIQRNDK